MPDVGLISPVGGVAIAGTAPVTFTSGAAAAQVDADIKLLWDLDNDGDWDETEEDVTAYLMSLECDLGRSWPSLLNGDPAPGRLQATLLNNDGRFSYFNASSPLATPPFSLKPGRALRVRLASATDNDPGLLVRDRFDRADNPASLGTAETGQSWLNIGAGGGFGIVGEGAQGHAVNNNSLTSVIDVGQVNMYAQAQIAYYTPQQLIGLFVATTNPGTNNVRLYLNTDDEELHITQTVGGVTTDLLTQAQPMWDGMTIGLGVNGTLAQTATAYIDGVPVAVVALPSAPVGTHVGLYGQWTLTGGRAPKFLDFWCWDDVAAPIDGVLWTGDLVNVEPASMPGGPNLVTVTGEGRLIRASNDVAAPRLARAGQPTGVLVGDALARAGLLHPPMPLDAGDVTTGPIGTDDDTALELARGFEATELGTIRETPEGPVTFDSRSATAAPSTAWFTDTPGVGQYPYSSITPKDHRGDLVNEAGAEVAARAPEVRSQTETAVTVHVDATVPGDTLQGDLIIVTCVTSLHTAGVEWLKPIWWQSWYDRKDEYGTRVYTRPSDGTEAGNTFRFYDNTGGSPGISLVQVTVIKAGTWFGIPRGISAGEIVSGFDPGPSDFSWGRYPTLFIAYAVGLGAFAPGIAFTTVAPPAGYGNQSGNIALGTSDGLDVGFVSSYKVDVTDAENPGLITGLTNVITAESFVLAIRGWNGPHTAATLENPNVIGGDGVRVSRADRDSQHEHQVKRVAQVTPVFFADEGDAEAYLDAVLTEYATERPVLELSFYATSSADLRGQAVARRQGDKITVTATGDADLGVEGDFIIGHVAHSFTNGGKLWTVTWQLAPAA
jgi:hypothetical protein